MYLLYLGNQTNIGSRTAENIKKLPAENSVHGEKGAKIPKLTGRSSCRPLF